MQKNRTTQKHKKRKKQKKSKDIKTDCAGRWKVKLQRKKKKGKKKKVCIGAFAPLSKI